MTENHIEGMPKMYQLSEWQITTGTCDCCGDRKDLRPMIRPIVQPLSDELLLKMSEEFGQEYAEDYHLSSRKYTKTRECTYCRELPDDKFFVLVSVREDR